MNTSSTEAGTVHAIQRRQTGRGSRGRQAKWARPVLLLMGVSGSGKTTIALELQRLLKWPYIDGDDLHPPANVERCGPAIP